MEVKKINVVLKKKPFPELLWYKSAAMFFLRINETHKKDYRCMGK